MLISHVEANDHPPTDGGFCSSPLPCTHGHVAVWCSSRERAPTRAAITKLAIIADAATASAVDRKWQSPCDATLLDHLLLAAQHRSRSIAGAVRGTNPDAALAPDESELYE